MHTTGAGPGSLPPSNDHFTENAKERFCPLRPFFYHKYQIGPGSFFCQPFDYLDLVLCGLVINQSQSYREQSSLINSALTSSSPEQGLGSNDRVILPRNAIKQDSGKCAIERRLESISILNEAFDISKIIKLEILAMHLNLYSLLPAEAFA